MHKEDASCLTEPLFSNVQAQADAVTDADDERATEALSETLQSASPLLFLIVLSS